MQLCFHRLLRKRASALQAFLSRDCPLLQRALPARLRLLFAAGTLSYAAAAVTTPLFAGVPVIAVAGGVFPLALTPRLVAAAVPYFVAQHAGALCTRPMPSVPAAVPALLAPSWPGAIRLYCRVTEPSGCCRQCVQRDAVSCYLWGSMRP